MKRARKSPRLAAAGGAGPSTADAAPAGTCTRCLEPLGRSRCRVPHPAHLRQDHGGTFNGGKDSRFLSCDACEQRFSLESEMLPGGGMTPPMTQGAQWCFDGRHSAAPLPESDRRRVTRHAVALEVGPELQAQLDALPEDVETLTVSSCGWFDSSRPVTLARRLPRLHTLQLLDVCFSRVHLTPETTPALRALQLQNLPDDCDLRVVCPQLRDVSLQFWRAHDKPHVIDDMLRAATQLESFESYKLWSNDALCFASPALRSISVHRSDSLESICIWAPNLTSLRLQGCYSLASIDFPATHTLAAALPARHACREPLLVLTENSILGDAAKRALRAHPRAVKVRFEHDGDEDEEHERYDDW